MAFATMGMLAFQSLGAGDPPGQGPWALWTFLPAMLPLGIGLVLLMSDYAATAPERRQQSIDRVATALVERGGVTPEELGEELDLDHNFTREAVSELIEEGRLLGYIEPGSGRIQAMDPTLVRADACPACGGAIEAPGPAKDCPHCASRLLLPRDPGE
jgi:hypothetical protein